MPWSLSHRFDPRALPLADRHYNRQKIGSPQFVPPGRCVVLLSRDCMALWVTSWPFANLFAMPGRAPRSIRYSDARAPMVMPVNMIRSAVAVTRSIWEPPPLGIITFVDPNHVPPKIVRGKPIYGYSYLKAGWKHVGFTAGGLWAWQQLPAGGPRAYPPYSDQFGFSFSEQDDRPADPTHHLPSAASPAASRSIAPSPAAPAPSSPWPGMLTIAPTAPRIGRCGGAARKPQDGRNRWPPLHTAKCQTPVGHSAGCYGGVNLPEPKQNLTFARQPYRQWIAQMPKCFMPGELEPGTAGGIRGFHSR